MNNIIEPNTEVEILSLEHLAYVKKLAEGQGYKRWSCINLADNETRYVSFHSDMEFTQNVYTCYLDKFKRVTLPMPDTSPKPPFKLRNANHPAVRQWLKDMGYEWRSDGCLVQTHLDVEFIYIDESRSATKGFDLDFLNSHEYPELTLNLAITSWEMPEPIDEAKLERMERIKAIEAELDKLKQMDS